MFHHQTWKDAVEELSYMKEEYNLLYKINEKRMFDKKCAHNKKVYLYHMPINQFWMMVCDDCGLFNPVMCGCGGSGYMCNHHIETLADEVVIVSVQNDKISIVPINKKKHSETTKFISIDTEKNEFVCADGKRFLNTTDGWEQAKKYSDEIYKTF